MSPVALRIVNDVSYVTRINHENHFAWQAQHLVTLVTLVLCALQMSILYYFVKQGLVLEKYWSSTL